MGVDFFGGGEWQMNGGEREPSFCNSELLFSHICSSSQEAYYSCNSAFMRIRSILGFLRLKRGSSSKDQN